jgi:hypothetical protein
MPGDHVNDTNMTNETIFLNISHITKCGGVDDWDVNANCAVGNAEYCYECKENFTLAFGYCIQDGCPKGSKFREGIAGPNFEYSGSCYAADVKAVMSDQYDGPYISKQVYIYAGLVIFGLVAGFIICYCIVR